MEFRDGRVLAYDKWDQTAAMRHIDYGLGVLRRAAFDVGPADEPYDLASLYQTLVRRNELAAYEVGQRFYEIGSLEGLAETRRYLGARAEEAS